MWLSFCLEQTDSAQSARSSCHDHVAQERVSLLVSIFSQSVRLVLHVLREAAQKGDVPSFLNRLF